MTFVAAAMRAAGSSSAFFVVGGGAAVAGPGARPLKKMTAKTGKTAARAGRNGQGIRRIAVSRRCMDCSFWLLKAARTGNHTQSKARGPSLRFHSIHHASKVMTRGTGGSPVFLLRRHGQA